MRRLVILACLLLPPVLRAQDSDRDGLPDALEQALLQQYAPHLQIAVHDCADRPWRFAAGIAVPTPAAADGTVYGQASPHGGGEIELHFYHLWAKDCGRMGHPLDAEHVSALLRLQTGADPALADSYRAVYWYAAAHEDTVCDAGHLARANTVNAEKHGPEVWVSGGKHGSFLAQELCRRGCGGDRCEETIALPAGDVINVGELAAPMNAAVWTASALWPGPLRDKLVRSDFPPSRTDRLDRLPDTDIAWANPARRPTQGAVLGANAGVDGALTGVRSTDTALVVAGSHTGSALGTATRSTGRALKKSWEAVRKATGGNTSAKSD